mgnify:CR=1|jgi:hypothetical protein
MTLINVLMIGLMQCGGMDEKEKRIDYPLYSFIGLVCGPIVAAVILISPPPDGLSQQGWFTAAVGIWMATW